MRPPRETQILAGLTQCIYPVRNNAPMLCSGVTLRVIPVRYNAQLEFLTGFTEHGAIMVASVLNTEKAIQISVFVVRAFVKLREMLSTHKELAHKLAALERKLQNHDESIRSLVAAIRQLMAPPESEPPKRRIGFLVEEPYVPYVKKQKRR